MRAGHEISKLVSTDPQHPNNTVGEIQETPRPQPRLRSAFTPDPRATHHQSLSCIFGQKVEGQGL